MKVHPVFHVSLLKTYHSNGRVQPPPVPYKLDGELHYDVMEKVLDQYWVFKGRATNPSASFLCCGKAARRSILHGSLSRAWLTVLSHCESNVRNLFLQVLTSTSHHH